MVAGNTRQKRFGSPLTMPLDADHARPGPLRRLDFPSEARSPAAPRAARCGPTARERATHAVRPSSSQGRWLPRCRRNALPRTLPLDDDNAPPGPLLRRLEFPAEARSTQPERLRRVPSAAVRRAPSSIAPVARARGASLGAVLCQEQESVERESSALCGKADRQDLSCPGTSFGLLVQEWRRCTM
jgi:hypothetical protein